MNKKQLIIAWIVGIIALLPIILPLISKKRFREIDKKIANYEKITKQDYHFWRKHYRGFTTYRDYETYMQIRNLPPEKRDPFKAVDFSKYFKNIK